MKRRWVYVVLSVFLMIFLLYSCTSPTGTNEGNKTNEVTITIDREGAQRNASFVAVQDGLEGTWKELTGSNGTYEYKVNDSAGVYSIVAVDEETGSDHFHTFLFHGTLAEAKTVNFEFKYDESIDFARLSITVPESYANAAVSVFFLKHEAPYNIPQDGKTVVELPKGSGELVVVIHDLDTGAATKVYIDRAFSFQGDKSLTIEESKLKSFGKEIEGGDSEITYYWVLSKTLVPGSVISNMKIPDEEVKSSDRYMAEYLQWGEPFINWWKVTKEGIPTTVTEGIKTLGSAASTISDTGTENELPKVSFNRYESPITGYDVKYYNFDISKRIGTDPSPVGTHFITVTPGYLEKTDYVYTFPEITLDNWKSTYNPVDNYVVQSLKICLSPNTIDQINSLAPGTEWTVFLSDLVGSTM
ncbi:MAG TPA: hypothetical protein PK574_04160 [Fervidobacterium sp.]|nr:hypothetical protein [Fervidobacterium sp.]HPT54104.1 hypothetical protein [Fervidobacterium sp.]